MTLRFLSVCSGIEAASVAWAPLGWKAAALSEIDKFPSAVLAHHYPDVPNLGDMTQFKEWPDLGSIDLLCGGTPCQSFSHAGLRKGLDDPRGNLMLTFGAIAARYRPKWLVWENVPGVLSSNGGRDFGSFLGLLGQLGYGFAYRVLDAQFVRVDGYARAVPQRRQRVFVVGCLGDWRSAAAVLLERESLRGDSAPRRVSGASVAGSLAPGAHPGGFNGQDAYSGQLVAGTLTGGTSMGGMGPGGRIQGAPYGHILPVSMCLNAKGGAGRLDGESETLIPTTGAGFDAAQVIPFDTTQITSAANYSNTTALDHNSPPPALLTATEVRRLMPVECERLQGFPDDYTLIPHRGKPAADGPRYKALGNSWAVNCARWIGLRIAMVEDIHRERAA